MCVCVCVCGGGGGGAPPPPNTLPSLNLGGPPQHLISGPGSERGVNEGLASLFFLFVTLSLIPFRFCLASSVNHFTFRRKLDKAIRARKGGDLCLV